VSEPSEIDNLTGTRYFEPGMATPKVCQGLGDCTIVTTRLVVITMMNEMSGIDR
jgi:hypothetical protein